MDLCVISKNKFKNPTNRFHPIYVYVLALGLDPRIYVLPCAIFTLQKPTKFGIHECKCLFVCV